MGGGIYKKSFFFNSEFVEFYSELKWFSHSCFISFTFVLFFLGEKDILYHCFLWSVQKATVLRLSLRYVWSACTSTVHTPDNPLLFRWRWLWYTLWQSRQKCRYNVQTVRKNFFFFFLFFFFSCNCFSPNAIYWHYFQVHSNPEW